MIEMSASVIHEAQGAYVTESQRAVTIHFRSNGSSEVVETGLGRDFDRAKAIEHANLAYCGPCGPAPDATPSNDSETAAEAGKE